MTAVEIVEITDAADRAAAFAIRHAVFCGEQRVDPAIEFDGLDDDCRHYLARSGAIAVGTARIRDAGDGVVKIERVAVPASERGRGIGKALMVRTIADARAAGAAAIAIHAQCHAEEFYRSLGFKRIGGVFDEADIPHVRMELDRQ
jgi:predicted GNAT family N-acyltransferase